MKNRKKITKVTKRPSHERTRSDKLKALSSNAFSMGNVAKKTYASVRISFSHRNLKTLFKISNVLGVSFSKATRTALDIGEQLEAGNRGQVMKTAQRLLRRKPRSKPRRSTKTAADIWAADDKNNLRHRTQRVRVTAWHLGNVAAEQDERKLNGYLSRGTWGRSYSSAFNALLHMGLMHLRAITEIVSRKELTAEQAKEAKPPRRKRNRTRTEWKRAVIERAYKTSL